MCCKLNKPNYKIVDDSARRDDSLALGALATSGRLQAGTRGNGAGRQNKGRNVSWPNSEANRFRESSGCSTERTGWEEQTVDRLRPKRHPGVWHSGGLESDDVKG